MDVVGIGNAIVDVLSRADEEFLVDEGLTKGTMALIDSAAARRLYDRVGPSVEASGGSCANTIAGIAALGGRVGFIGRVRDDELGRIFTHDIRAAGVRFTTAPATDGPSTARCLVMVTPDAERTMCTYLGASVDLAPADVDTDLIAAAAVTYLEGYLWDPPEAKAAFRTAMDAAKAAKGRVALTLSDPFCVDRHRDEFQALVDGPVDILFANHEELMALYQTDDLDAAVAAVRGRCEVAAVTRSAEGSLVVTAEDVHEVPAATVPRVVDTTGAGDLYAAGFLHGFTTGRALDDCARIGSIAAAEVIQHVGARPEEDLAALVASAGL